MRWQAVASTAVAVALVGCGGGPDLDRLEETLTVAWLRAAETTGVPYHVTQTEFQQGDGQLVWVTQLDDPVDLSLATGAATTDVLWTWPLGMYRDAVGPYLDDLDDVDLFILSFRDACQTVYAIEPATMRGWVDGTLSLDQVVAEMDVTGLTGC